MLAVDDRRNRLHLGYGLEPIISDASAKAMLDDLRPALQAAAYGDATEQLVNDVGARTAHLRPGEPIAAALGAIPWERTLQILAVLIAGLLVVGLVQLFPGRHFRLRRVCWRSSPVAWRPDSEGRS